MWYSFSWWGGGRIDHTLAITALFCRDFKPSEWYTDTERIVYIENDCRIQCTEGQTVSVFATGSREACISTEGLKWELNQFRIGPDFFSISNVAEKDHIDIRLHSGSVLLILNY